MVLEATMLVLDNSEWMRNGDYTPSRWEAQTDAVNILFDAKTNSNPENVVGLMTMAGKSPEVLVTLTQDIGKILTALHSSKITGASNLGTGLNIAQLALKHRQNKNQRQRIIAFVGSPLVEDEADLVKLGKKLKKNNVAVDVINFGEDEQNEDKLAKFVEAVNSGENSHLLSIPAGPQLLSDIILSSSLLYEEGEGGGAGPSGGARSGGDNNFEFGVDPSMDPELAMALRMSLEEEQARQRSADPGSSSAAPTLSTVPEGASDSAAAESAAAADTTATQADASSTRPPATAAAATSTKAAESEPADVEMSNADAGAGAAADEHDEEDLDEEEAIKRAIEMSLGQGEHQDEDQQQQQQ
ncbi:proteasome regulatory particle base subunit rpn10 [Tilletia horrida]|nr:proteasome regulatory particle base subunit rpn10 [Tilletia horrida]